MRKEVIKDIEEKIRILNYIVTFIVYVLLFLVVRFLYYAWDFIRTPSIVAMLSIIALLILTGLYLSNKISKQAIEEIETYTNKLDRMLNLTLDIREEKYGDILLEKILGHAAVIASADAGSIMLIDKDKLVFKIVRGGGSKQLIGVSMPKTEGIAGWVVQRGEPLIVNDVKHDKRFSSMIDGLTGYETRSILCVPLRISTGVIGVLELLNKTSGPFTPEDVEIISYFADQAAIAIDRAKFYEDEKNYEIYLTDILVEAIDYHIPEKRGHSKRVARYSNIMARAINMSDEEKRRLYFACLLHDVGFLKIRPEDYFNKEEFMKHPVIGYEMIRPINFYADTAPFILYHHERYDGSGYPTKLMGEAIPLEARIIAIAEAFDTMMSGTSYRLCVSFDEAIEELKRNAGTQLDPELVDIFVNNIAPEDLK
ncbi:MAG: HD domain-containing phosphohydrolase [Nitrospirota bacterium]